MQKSHFLQLKKLKNTESAQLWSLMILLQSNQSRKMFMLSDSCPFFLQTLSAQPLTSRLFVIFAVVLGRLDNTAGRSKCLDRISTRGNNPKVLSSEHFRYF